MDLPKDNHVLRYAPFTRLHRDEDDNVIGVLPQAFELRLDRDEKYLSVNWIEFFEESEETNIEKTIKSFRESRKAIGSRMGKKSAFCLGNIGDILDACTHCKFPKVRIVYETPNKNNPNKTHAKVIRLPENDDTLLNIFACETFNTLVFNSDIED